MSDTGQSGQYRRTPEAPRNRIYSNGPTVDKVPEDKCRRCGKWVRFSTENGHLMAEDRSTGRIHGCDNP